MTDDLDALLARADEVAERWDKGRAGYSRNDATFAHDLVVDLAAAVRTLRTERDAIDRYAEELDKAGLLQNEYPDEMARRACNCEPDAVCGAHRLLARYHQLFQALQDADAKKRSMRAEHDKATTDYDTALDVIARLLWGWTPPDGPDDCWYLEPGMDDGMETELAGKAPVTDAERAVLAAAETRRQDL